jgi:cytochrome oxidase Cu insertion factor (SCO1/SenC/PrrC family)
MREFREEFMKIRTAIILVMFFTSVLTVAAQQAEQLTAQAEMQTKPLAVGEMAREFKLIDHRGKSIALTYAFGKTSTVLVFYRGYW